MFLYNSLHCVCLFLVTIWTGYLLSFTVLVSFKLTVYLVSASFSVSSINLCSLPSFCRDFWFSLLSLSLSFLSTKKRSIMSVILSLSHSVKDGIRIIIVFTVYSVSLCYRYFKFTVSGSEVHCCQVLARFVRQSFHKIPQFWQKIPLFSWLFVVIW